ncbi:MAG TPA: S24 family peptidase [Burkholderiaceae bacterium]|nr:S24 family peptidase [Burkholderiaceae bacterium]
MNEVITNQTRNIELELEMQAPSCAGGESFALMVLGHSMAPEFLEGEIIIIEPEGLAKDGSFVLVNQNNEWTFRQLKRAVDDSSTSNTAKWILHPLNPNFSDEPLDNFSDIKGVIIQKALPGRRRASKFYV